VPKFAGMFLASILIVASLSMMISDSLNYKSFCYVTAIFLSGIIIYHYFFIWFPGALQKTESLVRVVKIIYSSIEEAQLGSPSPFKFILKNSVEKAWKEFFLEAFTVIDREIKDETIRNWIFNKIKRKLSADRSGREVKKALKKIVGDSKYRYLFKDEL